MSMKLKLDYDEICNAVEEYIVKHHPTLKVTSDDTEYVWTTGVETDRPDDRWPSEVEVTVETVEPK